MNFPGLELVWNSTHRALRGGGVIRPWNLDRSRMEVGRGAHVLVVASTALGDSLLCTPLLKALSATLGPQQVHFLVREQFAELYQNTPWIGRVLTVPGKFRGFGKLRHELREQPCEVALIANCTEPDLVPWLWWCGVRGFLRYRTRWSAWPGWFANRDAMHPPDHPLYATGHAIENNLAMAEALSIKPASRRLEIFFADEEKPAPPDAKPLVLIHPGASRPGKCWPLERWAAVARGLENNSGCKFTVTGSAAEKSQAEELCRLMPPGAENLAGQLTLRELARLQRRAALFLSGDTGPYHLAVAAGCPTVTLFAPRDRGSSIEACGPSGVDAKLHRALQTANFNEPIDSIPLELVAQTAAEVLKNSPARK